MAANRLQNAEGPRLPSSSEGDERPVLHSNSNQDEVRSNSKEDSSNSRTDESPINRSNSKKMAQYNFRGWTVASFISRLRNRSKTNSKREDPLPRSKSKREDPLPRSKSKREDRQPRSNIKERIRDLFRGWKVASYILGLVFSDNLADTVVVSNLMSYLMDVMEEKLPRAAATVNLRTGVSVMMAICGTLLADAYIGRYRTVVYSTIAYITGLSLLTLSVSPLLNVTTTRTRISLERLAVFYVALLLIALGKASFSPVLKGFFADRLPLPKSKDEEVDNPQEKKENHVDEGVKRRVNLWWLTGWFSGAVVGMLLLAVVEHKQGLWLICFVVLALTMSVAFGVFIYGNWHYRTTEPLYESGLTCAFRVCVAAMLKTHLNYPASNGDFHQGDDSSSPSPTDKLRFLNKAAIKEDLEEQGNSWTLCTVREVEDTKRLFFMFPMWTTFFFYGLVKSLGATFFLEQGRTMNRKLGHIIVPLPSLLIFSAISSVIIRGCCVKLSKKLSEDRSPPVMPPTWEIGIGMGFTVLCCGAAHMVETNRLGVVEQHHLADKPDHILPMSVFWLVPQFLLLGAMDGFSYPGIKRFFCSQVPESMKNFGPLFTESVIGIGNLLSVIVIVASDKGSRLRGQPSWFADTLNKSRLDCFYLTLTILSFIGFIFHRLVERTYPPVADNAQPEDEPYAYIYDATDT